MLGWKRPRLMVLRRGVVVEVLVGPPRVQREAGAVEADDVAVEVAAVVGAHSPGRSAAVAAVPCVGHADPRLCSVHGTETHRRRPVLRAVCDVDVVVVGAHPRRLVLLLARGHTALDRIVHRRPRVAERCGRAACGAAGRGRDAHEHAGVGMPRGNDGQLGRGHGLHRPRRRLTEGHRLDAAEIPPADGDGRAAPVGTAMGRQPGDGRPGTRHGGDGDQRGRRHDDREDADDFVGSLHGPFLALGPAPAAILT